MRWWMTRDTITAYALMEPKQANVVTGHPEPAIAAQAGELPALPEVARSSHPRGADRYLPLLGTPVEDRQHVPTPPVRGWQVVVIRLPVGGRPPTRASTSGFVSRASRSGGSRLRSSPARKGPPDSATTVTSWRACESERLPPTKATSGSSWNQGWRKCRAAVLRATAITSSPNTVGREAPVSKSYNGVAVSAPIRQPSTRPTTGSNGAPQASRYASPAPSRIAVRPARSAARPAYAPA